MICGRQSGPSNRRFDACRQKVAESSDASCYLTGSQLASDQGLHGQKRCPRGLRQAGQNGQKSSQKCDFPRECCVLSILSFGQGGRLYISIKHISLFLSIYTHALHTHLRVRVYARACEALGFKGFKVVTFSVSVSRLRSLLCDDAIDANITLVTHLAINRIGSHSREVRYAGEANAVVTRRLSVVTHNRSVASRSCSTTTGVGTSNRINHTHQHRNPNH
jgi:hypothetical protein